MAKAIEMGKTSAIGVFQLFVGRSISTITLGIGSIILGRLMLPSDYGLYSLALVPSVMFNLFHDWGVDSALIKYVVNYRSHGREENIRDLVSVVLMFKFITGLALSIISLFLTHFIAVTIFNRPEIAPLLIISSIVILSDSLLAVSQANFIGFEQMNFKSYTLIFQSLLKTTLGPLLVLAGYGALGAVLGHTFSFIFSALIGVLLLYFFIFKRLEKNSMLQTNKIEILKMLLRYGVPLSLSSILAGFRAQFYSILMGIYCNDVMIGNYQIALNFALILSFVTFPISTVLFPAFSKLNLQTDRLLLQKIFKSSVNYTTLLLVPATTAVIVLSQPIIGMFFHEKYVYAPFFLALYVTIHFFSASGKISLYAFLTGVGKTKTLLNLNVLTLIIGIPMSLFFIPAFGITGLILVTILADIPSLLLGLYWIWKDYEISANWLSLFKIYVATGVAVVTTYVTINALGNVEWLQLIIGAIVFLITYIVSAPFVGAVTQDDLRNLRKMFSSLGFIASLINILFILTEKIFKISRKKQKKLS